MDKQSYLKTAEEAVLEVQRLVNDHQDWSLRKETSDALVYSTKLPDSKLTCFKGEINAHMSMEKIMDLVHPSERYRPRFDPFIDRCDIIEELNDTVAIVHQKFKPTFKHIISPRDAIDLAIYGETETSKYFLITSIKHPKFPPTNQFVRGWAHPMGVTAIKTSDPNQCRVVSLSHIDFNLPPLIPQTLIDSLMPANVIKYLTCLKSMENQEIQPLSLDIPFYRSRKIS
uniref:START domain-containing protein n=1 Tax=Romanomermis culicivorax TaxID=13658 RepID=A0A915KPA1_ROMCU